MFYFLESPFGRKSLLKHARQGAASGIAASDLKKLKVPKSSIKNQMHVIEILSTWDAAIKLCDSNQKKLMRLSMALKKKLTSKAMNSSKKFAIDKIGRCAKTFAGGTPSTSRKEYWSNGTIPWMSSGEVKQREVSNVEGKITDLGLKESAAKIVPVNSVLIALAGQGTTRGKVAMNRIPLSTNQSLAAIICDDSKLSSEYLFHFLDDRYQELRKLSDAGGGRGGLNLKIINDFNVEFPIDIKDQKTIADCLWTIESAARKFENLKFAYSRQKDGLTQKIFGGS